MDIRKRLDERFAKAVKKALPFRTPLIGPKWLRPPQKGQADFEFVGIPKLAKATGEDGRYIAEKVLKNLNVDGLNVDVELRDDLLVNITLRKPAGGGEE